MADQTTDNSSPLSDISIKAGTLAQIKEKETALRDRLVKARREAGEIIAGAKEESRMIKEKMAADARKRSQELLQTEVAKAKNEAEATVNISSSEMETIRSAGEKNVPSAVQHVMRLVIPTFKP